MYSLKVHPLPCGRNAVIQGRSLYEGGGDSSGKTGAVEGSGKLLQFAEVVERCRGLFTADCGYWGISAAAVGDQPPPPAWGVHQAWPMVWAVALLRVDPTQRGPPRAQKQGASGAPLAQPTGGKEGSVGREG